MKAAEDAKSLRDARRTAFASSMERGLLTVDQYAKAVDVMVQHQPEVTAIIWGSVRAMITVR